MRTLVVLPTYQEAANLAAVLRDLRQAVPSATLLVVDDNSPDGTADVADAVGRKLGNIEILRRAAKTGLAGAYCAGFAVGLERGYDVIAHMDSDRSHDPAALPALLAALEKADMVIGSRYIAGGSIPDWPRWRRALSAGGNRYATLLLGLKVRDATSGFRVYRAELLRTVNPASLQADGYGFLIEMTHRVGRAGATTVEIPITFSDRVEGSSKMSLPIVAEALVLVTRLGIRGWSSRRRSKRSSTGEGLQPAP